MFDDLTFLAPIHGTALSDELTLYLNTEPENVKDAVQWWYEKRKTYPRLHRMALDYLTIPGMCNYCIYLSVGFSFAPQQHLWMLNVSSVVVVFSCHTHVADCQWPQHGPCYVLGLGVFWIWFGMKTLRLSLR